MNTEADPAPAGEQTVDQLAHEAGLPVSTVRMYQSKRLLPPPVKRGRVGFYGEEHRARLRAIASLQERGFSLAAIREVFDSWESGRTVSHLIDLSEIAPGLTRQNVRLTMSELAEQFDGVPLLQADILRGVELGILSLDGTDVVVRNAALADLGPTAVRLGLPVSDILDQYEVLHGELDAIAGRFRDLFDEYIWQPFVDEGMPEDRALELASEVSRMAQLATSVVVTELADRFASFAQDYVERASNGAS